MGARSDRRIERVSGCKRRAIMFFSAVLGATPLLFSDRPSRLGLIMIDPPLVPEW